MDKIKNNAEKTTFPNIKINRYDKQIKIVNQKEVNKHTSTLPKNVDR